MTSYTPPPRIRDAERHWPYMRCKNVANALQLYYNPEPLPRNHAALLEHIARVAEVSVEVLKKTSPYELFKNNYNVTSVIAKYYSMYWVLRQKNDYNMY
jgi:hypothetical protein